MNHEVYLALGSNLGDRAGNIRAALHRLESQADVDVVATSSLYETAPAGMTEQPEFINAATKIKTSLDPQSLLKCVKSIEKDLGRVKTVRWGPRIIDIDILLYDDLVLEEAALKIPHPEMKGRAFVMVPLSEIGYNVIHPLTGRTVGEMASEFTALKGIRKWE